MHRVPQIIGSEYFAEILNGSKVPYLNLDHAATTPTFKVVMDKLTEFMGIYGSVHRGSGIKSQISTRIYDESIEKILSFLGVTPLTHHLLATSNTTTAINKLARMLDFTPNDLIFLSDFEHSSNDLPWRNAAKLCRIPASRDGLLDIETLEHSLIHKRGRGKCLVALSGASNITGALVPIHDIARICHANGTYLMVDAGQLVAHREINLLGATPEEQIDFITFSGHKMYAPFGGGIMVGRKEILENLLPDDMGGGTIDFSTYDSYDIARDFNKRMAAGTPNVVGLVSMALACEILKNRVGYEYIVSHEQQLLDKAKDLFPTLPRVTTYCDLAYDTKKKCAIIAFNIEGMSPSLVAARLGHEFGIGVRQGAICQFMYVAQLLGLTEDQIQTSRNAILSGNHEGSFGIVRASFGLENTPEDVERLAGALETIAETSAQANNYSMTENGEYWPKNKPETDVSSFFRV